MAGFIRTFTTGLRISFCAKQVYAGVEQLSQEQGARLALMTALYRAKMVHEAVPGSSATLSEIVLHPMAYRREICYTAFCLVGDIREISREKIRSYASFKIMPSPEMLKHTEICDLSLSLLMSTMAVGYKPATLEVVEFAWERVTSFLPQTSDVDRILSMPEHLLADILEAQLEPETWLEMARQRPDFLKKTAA